MTTTLRILFVLPLLTFSVSSHAVTVTYFGVSRLVSSNVTAAAAAEGWSGTPQVTDDESSDALGYFGPAETSADASSSVGFAWGGEAGSGTATAYNYQESFFGAGLNFSGEFWGNGQLSTFGMCTGDLDQNNYGCTGGQASLNVLNHFQGYFKVSEDTPFRLDATFLASNPAAWDTVEIIFNGTTLTDTGSLTGTLQANLLNEFIVRVQHAELLQTDMPPCNPYTCSQSKLWDHSYYVDFDFQMTPVPVPAAVWLFGGALGALGMLRRKPKAAA